MFSKELLPYELKLLIDSMNKRPNEKELRSVLKKIMQMAAFYSLACQRSCREKIKSISEERTLRRWLRKMC